jgi:hypothetical protein
MISTRATCTPSTICGASRLKNPERVALAPQPLQAISYRSDIDFQSIDDVIGRGRVLLILVWCFSMPFGTLFLLLRLRRRAMFRFFFFGLHAKRRRLLKFCLFPLSYFVTLDISYVDVDFLRNRIVCERIVDDRVAGRGAFFFFFSGHERRFDLLCLLIDLCF